MTPIAVTLGDPAGIGPELCLKLAENPPAYPLVLVGSARVLETHARALGLNLAVSADAEGGDPGSLNIPIYQPGRQPGPVAPVQLLDVETQAPGLPGTLDPRNAGSVIRTLDLAFDGCARGEFAAMVTCPLHKGVINDAGIAFTGHTEYLAQRAQVSRVVMLLAAGDLRVALATTHLPLSEVSAAIQPAMLTETLQILAADLRRRFAIEQPAIAVCGLNPHAGEGGHLGREEQTVIEPVLEHLRGQGMRLTGPLPADTLFTPRVLERHDAVLAMYHDQGLPVLKYVGFGGAVNVTLGLPVVRTSVDHGTALDIAGQGIADPGSLQAALAMAVEMTRDTSQNLDQNLDQKINQNSTPNTPRRPAQT